MSKPSEKKPVLTLSGKGVAGWLVVIFLVSAWMFGMGVMVGRGTAPVQFDIDQLKRTLASMQKAAQSPQRSGPPVEVTEMKDKTKLDFYEDLPKGREELNALNIPKTPPPAARPETAAPRPAEAPAAAKPEKPAPGPPAVPPPAPAPVAPGRPLTVQVSAVKSEEEARRLVDKLRQRGYAAYIEPIALAEKGTWYRVRMGEFPSKEFARSTVDRLQKDGFVPEIVPK